jgi:hypothetical protein
VNCVTGDSGIWKVVMLVTVALPTPLLLQLLIFFSSQRPGPGQPAFFQEITKVTFIVYNENVLN